MTRDEAAEYGSLIGIKPESWSKQIVMINTILAIKQFEICNNCKFNFCGCSVQDSILQVDPEATFETFETFGCNSFEICK